VRLTPSMANQPPDKRTPPKKQRGQGTGPRTINGAALDVRAASAFCGFSQKQTRGLVARQLIPHRRLSARIIFLRTELEQWLSGLEGCTLDDARKNQAARRRCDEN
jgi:hypothetical protein